MPIKTEITLRPYQDEAVREILRAWHVGENHRVLLSLPTGAGKTHCAAYIVGAWADGLAADHGLPDRVLWLAHRDELITQAAAHIESITGELVAIEKGAESIFGKKGSKSYDRRVVCSSIQTMQRDERREKFGPDEFGLVVVDEAHHVVAESYRKVIDYFTIARCLGMTATCDRSDQKSLGQVFDAVAYHYDLLEAIKDGWLAPITQRYVEVEGLDWSQVRLDSSGDLSAEDVERVILEEDALHRIVAPAVKLVGDRQTMIFCPTVAAARAVAGVLPRYTAGDVVFVAGDTPEDERREAVSRYLDGRAQFCCSCDVFLEGVDFPRTSAIVVARPTKSRLRYSQLVGRGLRGGPKAPVNGKTDCLVIDLMGASLKHKLISSVNLLGGAYDEAIVEAAAAWVREKAKDVDADVLEALAEATCNADRIMALQRARIIAEAKLKKKTIDPFLVFTEALDRRPPDWWQVQLPTERQCERLKALGINAKGLTGREAEQLLEAAGNRARDGICTYKQARILRSRGFSAHLTREEASEILDWMSSRPGGFTFTREDGRRLAQKKRLGRPIEYRDLQWRFSVPPNVLGQERQCGTTVWKQVTTRQTNTFSQIVRREDDKVVFARDGRELRIHKNVVEKKLL